MKNLHLIFIVIVLLAFNTTATAKTLGNFRSYKQITDKEILIESTNGSQILVSAYNDFAIGVTVVNSESNLEITTPIDIAKRNDLSGSIYVEELDELMQITTAISDGLVIKIEKKPLRFTYVDKSTSDVMFEDLTGVRFGKKSNDINFSASKNETIELLSNNKFETLAKPINEGDVINFGEVNNLIHPNNEICLVSSKGYAVIFESELEHEINYSKSEKIKVSVKGQQDNFSYLLVYGNQQPELIEKYAFHIKPQDKQISLR